MLSFSTLTRDQTSALQQAAKNGLTELWGVTEDLSNWVRVLLKVYPNSVVYSTSKPTVVSLRIRSLTELVFPNSLLTDSERDYSRLFGYTFSKTRTQLDKSDGICFSSLSSKSWL